MSDPAQVQARLAALFHQRQATMVRAAQDLASKLRRLAVSLARDAAEAAAGTRRFDLRVIHDKLDAMVIRLMDRMIEEVVKFGEKTWDTAVDSFLRALPSRWLADLVQGPRQQEATIVARSELEGLPRDELEAAVRRLLFPPPSQDDVYKWLTVAPPGGKSWDERLRSWVEKTRAAMLTQITQGLAAGETPDQIEKRLRPFADGLAYKSERLARTEACRVAERANLAMCDQLGTMVAGQQIFAVMDEWTRPHHAARHGRTYWRQPDGVYRDDQGNPLPELPDEPNCRCMTVPVLNTSDVIRNTPQIAAVTYAAMATAPTPIAVGYQDWWKSASEKERMTAVGVNRYQVAKKLLRREPQWIELIDTEGKLLPVDVLQRETAEERAKRVAAVKGAILQQELAHLGLVRTGGILPARLPGVTSADQAVRVIERRIRGESLEHGFFVTDDGTFILAKVGHESSILFRKEEAERVAGTTYTHNHPRSGPLSAGDVHTLVAGRLKAIRAVTEWGAYELRQQKTGLQRAVTMGQRAANEYQNIVNERLKELSQEAQRSLATGVPKSKIKEWWRREQERVREEALFQIARRYNLVFRKEVL